MLLAVFLRTSHRWWRHCKTGTIAEATGSDCDRDFIGSQKVNPALSSSLSFLLSVFHARGKSVLFQSRRQLSLVTLHQISTLNVSRKDNDRLKEFEQQVSRRSFYVVFDFPPRRPWVSVCTLLHPILRLLTFLYLDFWFVVIIALFCMMMEHWIV